MVNQFSNLEKPYECSLHIHFIFPWDATHGAGQPTAETFVQKRMRKVQLGQVVSNQTQWRWQWWRRAAFATRTIRIDSVGQLFPCQFDLSAYWSWGSCWHTWRSGRPGGDGICCNACWSAGARCRVHLNIEWLAVKTKELLVLLTFHIRFLLLLSHVET